VIGEAVERYYTLAGCQLRVSAHPAAVASLDARLALLAGTGTRCARSVAFDFDFSVDDGPVVERPRGTLRAVYNPREGQVLYGEESDLLYLELGSRVRAICEPASGRTRVSARDWQPEDLWLLSHPFLTLPLLETLKRRGLYGVHAAGLCRSDRCLLLAGTSGAGKTTLALALARGDFEFLGDDMLFLSTDQLTGALLVHSFPDEVDITDTTAAFYPDLHAYLRRPPGWPKWGFRPEDVFRTRVHQPARPAALVFPWIAHAETSLLERMPAEAALLELLPNVLLTHPTVCQQHLAALARLAQELPCYRLMTGRDFTTLPDRLGELLA
jgi:hypothetical protein